MLSLHKNKKVFYDIVHIVTKKVMLSSLDWEFIRKMFENEFESRCFGILNVNILSRHVVTMVRKSCIMYIFWLSNLAEFNCRQGDNSSQTWRKKVTIRKVEIKLIVDEDWRGRHKQKLHFGYRLIWTTLWPNRSLFTSQQTIFIICKAANEKQFYQRYLNNLLKIWWSHILDNIRVLS